MAKTETHRVKWGDIYYCDLGESEGSVQAKLRPVLIIQNNVGNENGPTTLVAAISSVIKKMYMPTHILLDTSCGLKKRSVVMLEQVFTVNIATDLRQYVGCISDRDTIEAVKKGIAIETGVIELPKKKKSDLILSLCPKCRNTFLQNPENILRRVNHLQAEKEKCDICQMAYGFDYIVKKRTPQKR